LRALGQMASGVAHDINNALSPIVAYSDLLLNTLPNLSPDNRRQLQIIRRSGEDIAHIVARLREFYRRRTDSEELSMVDVNQLMEEVVELSRPRWRDLSQREGTSIEIERKFQDDMPLLQSDPGDLREALLNLVFNAVDALPRGGKITLITNLVNLPAKQDGPSVRAIQVGVLDNGIGMDEKTRQHCLEPFFSTKAQHGGTGLGLAMVYGVMQRHEGDIEIQSAPGSGTCVRLTFPIRDKSVLTRASTAPEKKRRSLEVLCIDDDPHVQELLKDCLSSYEHRVTISGSGRQGVEIFRAAKKRNQPFQTVITDLGMPEFDGHQVARAIKAESPETPVIMLTGWGAAMKEDGEMADEVDALLSKPPQIERLNELLLQLTSQRGNGAGALKGRLTD